MKHSDIVRNLDWKISGTSFNMHAKKVTSVHDGHCPKEDCKLLQVFLMLLI